MVILAVLQKTTKDKLEAGTATEKVMFSLIWDIEELKRLNEKGTISRTDITIALDVLCMAKAAQREQNLQRKLGLIRTGMRDFLQGMYRYKRTPAAHMFVFMVSSSLRDRKPYAFPIQCLPYASLRESDMRRLVNNIVKEKVSLGMKVAGMYMCACITTCLPVLPAMDNLTTSEPKDILGHSLFCISKLMYAASTAERGKVNYWICYHQKVYNTLRSMYPSVLLLVI